MGNFIARFSSVVRPDPLKGQNIFRLDEIMGETHITITSALKNTQAHDLRMRILIGR